MKTATCQGQYNWFTQSFSSQSHPEQPLASSQESGVPGTTLPSSCSVGRSGKCTSNHSRCSEAAGWQELVGAGGCSHTHDACGRGPKLPGLGLGASNPAKEAQWMECWGVGMIRSQTPSALQGVQPTVWGKELRGRGVFGWWSVSPVTPKSPQEKDPSVSYPLQPHPHSWNVKGTW